MINVYVVWMGFSLRFLSSGWQFVYGQMGLVWVLFCSCLVLHVLGVDCVIVVYYIEDTPA